MRPKQNQIEGQSGYIRGIWEFERSQDGVSILDKKGEYWEQGYFGNFDTVYRREKMLGGAFCKLGSEGDKLNRRNRSANTATRRYGIISLNRCQINPRECIFAMQNLS